MLIWGWKTRFKTIETVQFHCPRCGADRQGARRQIRRWFTIFFIPTIPLKVLGEVVACDTCQQTFDPAVLATPTSYELGEQLVAAHRELTARMLRIEETPAGRTKAIALLSEIDGRQWSQADLDHDLATIDASVLAERLRRLAAGMADHGKERLLRAATSIVVGPAGVSNEARDALSEISAELGMSTAHARGVIDETIDKARA